MTLKSMIGAAALACTVGLVAAAFAEPGAVFTTFNTAVDGANVCQKGSVINCNIYKQKQFVWLNGGPLANGLGPDGDYFFAVLEPSGQPNPNDSAPGNLSDEDTYWDRTFHVTGGVVSYYGGTHDSYSQTYIRLAPYADTANPGGGYILAICSLAHGYPVDPRDCKYDFFTVKAE